MAPNAEHPDADHADPGENAAGREERAVAAVAEALRDVPGIDAAFIFGSTAKGTARPDSDVDVLVIGGEQLDRSALYWQCVKASIVAGRYVDRKVHSVGDLTERLGDPQRPGWSFFHGVWTGPKRWAAGRPEAIAEIERLCAAAARPP